MRTLAHCGKDAEAAQKADDLSKLGPKNVALQIAAARCYAACAAAAGDGAAKQRYTDHAVRALRAAVAAGYKDAVALKTDPDLAPAGRSVVPILAGGAGEAVGGAEPRVAQATARRLAVSA